MKKIFFLAVALTIAIISPKQSYGWGNKGHAMVSEIAFSFLDNGTKARVQKVLGAMTIEEAGNWMDNLRSDHNYDYMKTWHYLNLDKGAQYVPNTDNNIINALAKAIDALDHKSKLNDSEIKANVLIVFHLVGDMTMPLHVGYGADRGGNTIQVTYEGHTSNLHRVWDSEIIEREKITTEDCLAFYKTMGKEEINENEKINVQDWMNEPRALLDNVYNIPAGNAIDQAYIDRNKSIVEQQLVVAGIRLAAVLQEVFKA